MDGNHGLENAIFRPCREGQKTKSCVRYFQSLEMDI